MYNSADEKRSDQNVPFNYAAGPVGNVYYNSEVQQPPPNYLNYPAQGPPMQGMNTTTYGFNPNPPNVQPQPVPVFYPTGHYGYMGPVPPEYMKFIRIFFIFFMIAFFTIIIVIILMATRVIG